MTAASAFPVIGLTGAVAAGKSEAIAALGRLGAETMSADAVVHELLGTERVRDLLVGRWGEEVAPDGAIDRARVGAIVFERPDELAWLEQALHPLVGERMAAWREGLPDGTRAAVVEVPLLFETGRSEDFGAEENLPAASAGTGEAADLLAAVGAAANFADGRAALLVYALRWALHDVVGPLSLRAAWRVGGIEDRDGSLVHRKRLAAAGEGEVLVSGGDVAAGTGKMDGSVPPFGAPEDEGRHPWEEAGVLERWADLDPTEGRA